MTPKPSRMDEKNKTSKCRLVHFNGNRGRPGTVDCQNGVSNSTVCNKIPENYENLLVFYLTKLKNLFSSVHPTPASRENSALKMDKLQHNHNLRNHQRMNDIAQPYRYTSSNSPRPGDDDSIKSKVYRVVSAALEYGCANDVLEKKGDCFFLKNNRSRIATRQPTPGPRYCEKCCNVHKFVKGNSEDIANRFSERHKSMHRISENHLHLVQQGKVQKSYRQHPTGPCRHPYNGQRLKANVLRCPDCRELERKNTRM